MQAGKIDELRKINPTPEQTNIKKNITKVRVDHRILPLQSKGKMMMMMIGVLGCSHNVFIRCL